MPKRYFITLEVDEKGVKVIYKDNVIYFTPATYKLSIIRLLEILDKEVIRKDGAK